LARRVGPMQLSDGEKSDQPASRGFGRSSTLKSLIRFLPYFRRRVYPSREEIFLLNPNHRRSWAK
jgi:hypothetical protein